MKENTDYNYEENVGHMSLHNDSDVFVVINQRRDSLTPHATRCIARYSSAAFSGFNKIQ